MSAGSALSDKVTWQSRTRRTLSTAQDFSHSPRLQPQPKTSAFSFAHGDGFKLRSMMEERLSLKKKSDVGKFISSRICLGK
jgi:hypothetical protein